MAVRTDLVMQSDGDLPIGAALMTTAPSDKEHLKNCFAASPGDWKQFLQNGIGIRAYLKSNETSQLGLNRRARQQITADGYTVNRLSFDYDSGGKLIIHADATR